MQQADGTWMQQQSRQQHLQLRQQLLQQMRQMIQRVMRTDTLTTPPFGSPVEHDQGMQLDPEAPVDDVDVVTTSRFRSLLTTSCRSYLCA